MSLARWRRRAVVAAVAWATSLPVFAGDLGIEGQVFEILEEDLRLVMMRMAAAHDWTPELKELEQSARDYTKNLPARFLPRAEKTLTRWKDVGIVASEDIYLNSVNWETGSVFDPDSVLAVQAGTYLNPISDMPSAAIERLFIFDGLDPEQMTMARALIAKKIPQLSFMMIAGDVGELSNEVGQPIYYPPPTLLEKFHVRAVPTLIGFGRGAHQGHMAITEIHLPTSLEVVNQAWFGIGDQGEPMAAPAAAPVSETPTSPQG